MNHSQGAVPFLTVSQLTTYLFNKRPENKPDFKLDRMFCVLNKLGNPENTPKSIHIAGTNGKTSTSIYISRMLKEKGYKVGRFTSPHITSVLERIQIDDKEVDEDIFLEAANKVIPLIQICEKEHKNHGMFGFFEIITIIAFVIFKEQRVDFSVIEVGMGGKFDATNVIKKPVLSIITPIGIDHTQFLGSTLNEIALEKAGIIKQGSITVSAIQKDTVSSILKETDENVIFFESKDISYLEQNFSLAKFSLSKIGIMSTLTFSDISNIGGRLELHNYSPNLDIILDVSHNPHGIKELSKFIYSKNYKKTISIVAQFEDKDTKNFFEIVSSFSTSVIVTRNSSPRSRTVADIFKIAKSYKSITGIQKAESVKMAFELAKDELNNCNLNSTSQNSNKNLILVTGSFLTVADFKEVYPQ